MDVYSTMGIVDLYKKEKRKEKKEILVLCLI